MLDETNGPHTHAVGVDSSFLFCARACARACVYSVFARCVPCVTSGSLWFFHELLNEGENTPSCPRENSPDDHWKPLFHQRYLGIVVAINLQPELK